MNGAILQALGLKRHEVIVRRIAALKAGRLDEAEVLWRAIERLDRKIEKARA